MACVIFPDQGWNPCLLRWQADSLPLSYLGSPQIVYFLKVYIWNLCKCCCVLNYVSCNIHPTLCFYALATLLCGTSGSLPVTAVCLPTFCLLSGSCLIHCFSLSNTSQGKQALKSILIHTTSLYGPDEHFYTHKGSISMHLRSGSNNLSTIKLLCCCCCCY